MKKGFTGTGIAHIQRIPALNDFVFHKIILDQSINTFNADIRRNIAGFQVADQRVDEDSVADFDSNFTQIFMGSVHGITELKGSHIIPASFRKYPSGFCRSHVNSGVLAGVFGFAEYFNRTCQAYGLLLHHHLNTWMIIFGDLPKIFGGFGAFAHVHFFAFKLLVRFGHLKFFCYLHGGHELFAFRIKQRNFFADCDCSGLFLGSRKSYRNGPESAVRQKVIVANAFPVSLGHKTGQRAESADAHHDQVTFFTGTDIDFFKALCFFQFGCLLCAFEQTAGQAFSAMRWE